MSCDHSIVVEGICCECRSGVSEASDCYQRFNYLGNGLSLRHEFVGSLKTSYSRDALEKKKLHLVLSLFGTLSDSQAFPCLSNKEKYLKGKVNSRDDLWQTRIRAHEVLIKLRPFVHEFLREASKLFILHVHTLCIPEYADFVIKLLDPHKLYFGNRIVTSEHALWGKNLDLVLAGERRVIILDDRYDVWWPDNVSNLLRINTYSYFKATRKDNSLINNGGVVKNLFKFLVKMISKDSCLLQSDSTSFNYSEEDKDESVEDGALANALRFLNKVHHNFFNQDYNEDEISKRDVRVFLHS